MAVEGLASVRVLNEDVGTDFPPEYLSRWFMRCGVSLNCGLHEACSYLNREKVELFASYKVGQSFAASRIHGHTKAGTTGALKRALLQVASASAEAAVALAQLRGEITTRKFSGARSSDLEQGHSTLHESFLYGMYKRESIAAKRSRGVLPGFARQAEVGPRCTVAPTWLEEGLADLAEQAKAIAVAAAEMRLPSVELYGPEPRGRFIRASAAVWEVFCGTPTFMDAGTRAPGELSPFEKFHRQLCGHVTALLVRMAEVDWADADYEQRQSLRAAAKDMGIAPVPSASQLRRALTRQRSPARKGRRSSVT